MNRTRKPLPNIVTVSIKTEAKLIKKPFLEFHNEWGKTGKMSSHGLCCTDIDTGSMKKIFRKVNPTKQDMRQLRDEGFDTAYWGRGVYVRSFGERKKPAISWQKWRDGGGDSQYTSLRQFLVLLCAALNGELD